MISKAFRYVRTAKRLTQSAAAGALGITQVHLSNVENGKSAPSSDLVTRASELWGIDLNVLAWCKFGDVGRLPTGVRGPMAALATAWESEIVRPWEIKQG